MSRGPQIGDRITHQGRPHLLYQRCRGRLSARRAAAVLGWPSAGNARMGWWILQPLDVYGLPEEPRRKATCR